MKKRIFISIFLLLPVILGAQMMNVYTSDGNLVQFEVDKIDSIKFGGSVGKLTWIGHATFKIVTQDNIVIYIDPNAPGDYSEEADIILVSHGHGDHNKVNMVTRKAGCQIFSGPGANVGGSKLSAGETGDAFGINIKAVQAYNGNHPKGTGVGFVIGIGEKKLYHCGDTSKLDEMAELTEKNLDIAMLCIDGQYNMGPAEAMEAAGVIKAKTVIPMHTGFSDTERQNNVDAFNPAGKLVLKEGDSIYF